MRKSELIEATWDEVDFDNATWTIPKQRMKGRNPHVVYLSRQALDSGVTIRVEGTLEHGIATIWDADILIWAASQIVEARDAGIRPRRLR